MELNATFRRFTPVSSLQNWIAATPPDFRFAAKAHQMITHFRRLKDVAEPVRSFLENLDPLRQAGKLGPILFQVPPNLKADAALLEEFVQLLPRAYQCAFEVRHASWFNDTIFEMLKKKNVALCWAESEKLDTPNVATADFLYYRFRQPEYSEAQLNGIAEQLRSQVQDREVFAFFKHEETPEGALNAAKIARLFGIEEKPFELPAQKSRGSQASV